MSDEYVRFAWRFPELARAFEKLSELTADSLPVNFLSSLPLRRTPTRDESLAALEAFRSIGVLLELQGSWQVSSEALGSSKAYREGVLDAIEKADRERPDEVRVCAAPASQLPGQLISAIEHLASDLRSAILAIVAEAKESVVLAPCVREVAAWLA